MKGDATVAESHPVVAAASVQLTEYFAGDRVEFDLPLDLIGTGFQKAAWLALADVPYGETSSYGEQAERIGEVLVRVLHLWGRYEVLGAKSLRVNAGVRLFRGHLQRNRSRPALGLDSSDKSGSIVPDRIYNNSKL